MGDAGALLGGGGAMILCNLTPESKSAGGDDNTTVSLCVCVCNAGAVSSDSQSALFLWTGQNTSQKNNNVIY